VLSGFRSPHRNLYPHAYETLGNWVRGFGA